MEDIKAKLDLFALNEKEKNIALEKFLIDLVIVSYDELKEIAALLKEKGINITKARELKVVCNELSEILKKFSIIESINELDLYRLDPVRINKNALDVFKKIKYCMQIGKPYKKEDGSYENFLFSEAEWQKVFNKESETINNDTLNTNNYEDTIKEELDKVIPPFNEKDKEVDYMKNSEEELSDVTRPFSKIREELEGLKGQLAGLDEVKNNNFNDEISFNDIEPEVYRRAA